MTKEEKSPEELLDAYSQYPEEMQRIFGMTPEEVNDRYKKWDPSLALSPYPNRTLLMNNAQIVLCRRDDNSFYLEVQTPTDYRVWKYDITGKHSWELKPE